MKHNIIGCAGQAASGKDTVANYLVNKIATHSTWKRVGFADAVKKVFMDSFDVDLDFVEKWKRVAEVPEGFDVPVRKALQYIGDGFRQIQSDVWIQTALRNNFNMVISDARYVNEARMIQEKGGIVILIWRPGYENEDPNPSEAQIKPFVDWCVENCDDGPIQHYKSCPSCGRWWDELKYFDFFIRNDRDVFSLYKKVDEILIPFLKKRELI